MAPPEAPKVPPQPHFTGLAVAGSVGSGRCPRAGGRGATQGFADSSSRPEDIAIGGVGRIEAESRLMGMPAARLGDMHVCPMVTVLVPHVGGPYCRPGCPTVLIGGMPAARVGDMAVCVGPPDVIVLGSLTVLIGGMPAAQLGDMCAHGGAVVVGCPTVLIG